MTKKQLEALVSAVKSPPLDRKETRRLLEEYPNTKFQPTFNDEVAQGVAQHKKNKVAQSVAQALWVAQVAPQMVAQSKAKKVAQNRPQVVAQSKSKEVAQGTLKVAQNGRIKDKDELLIEEYVNKLKVQISKVQGVDERKRFIRDVGWGVMTEKRGRKYYLFGAKKLGGRKYKLYVGNATN